MSDERARKAIERIERALSRIEAAGGNAPKADTRELDALRDAHKALRGKVEGAIGQIDLLLADGGKR